MVSPRYAAPEEFVAMVSYLAGSEADDVTGANLAIDGGFTS